MDKKMKYGDLKLEIDVDEKNVIGVIKSNKFGTTKSEEEVIKEAIENPIDSARLKELVHEGETVCIVVPDVTRAWQRTDKYLPKLVEEINAGGVKDEDIIFLSATGTHRSQTEEEHEKILGKELSKRFKIIDHDCLDKNNLVYLGKTTYGTPVSINKIALSCNHIVITGGIVYHFLVGFSGGKKTILPGIASYESVMANHAMSLSKNFGGGTYETVRCGNIENNPIHIDMLQAASFVKPDFMFNVVVDKDGAIVGAVAGNYISAHAKGRKMIDEKDGVNISRKSDITIASAGGYPKDINLYQSIKIMINAREATKDNGTIVILAECRDGLGGDAEMQSMFLNFDTSEERERDLREKYSISKYAGYYFCEGADKFNVILVSSLDPKLVKRTNIKLVKTIEEALELVYKTNSKDATITLMPEAANTLPKLI
ncbi:lactate racemase domain-containing protein [Clostridium felsineum]|uniref:Lactate racemase n=1 Tax=Clostridium felsineum TaxID=36839 RepID=A0A1S8LZP1_9CLOT|nr:nickel-dependent lactate racemase [Clostridium felsineum]URZ09156.1 Lactate racemase [Clostridium felsineum]URZ13842.1 Lactate racemase [Clostridium felsineum]